MLKTLQLVWNQILSPLEKFYSKIAWIWLKFDTFERIWNFALKLWKPKIRVLHLKWWIYKCFQDFRSIFKCPKNSVNFKFFLFSKFHNFKYVGFQAMHVIPLCYSRNLLSKEPNFVIFESHLCVQIWAQILAFQNSLKLSNRSVGPTH